MASGEEVVQQEVAWRHAVEQRLGVWGNGVAVAGVAIGVSWGSWSVSCHHSTVVRVGRMGVRRVGSSAVGSAIERVRSVVALVRGLERSSVLTMITVVVAVIGVNRRWSSLIVDRRVAGVWRRNRVGSVGAASEISGSQGSPLGEGGVQLQFSFHLMDSVTQVVVVLNNHLKVYYYKSFNNSSRVFNSLRTITKQSRHD